MRQDIPWDPNRPITLACDWNVRLMVWEVIQQVQGRTVVIDEIAMSGPATVQATAKEFADRYAQHLGGVDLDGDSTGRNRSYMSEEALAPFEQARRILARRLSCPVKIVARQNPNPKARIMNLNDALLGIDEQPQIYVSNRCGHLIRDFSECVWNNAGTDADQVNDEDDPRHVLTMPRAASAATCGASCRAGSGASRRGDRQETGIQG